MEIRLYTTHCPKCNVLENKLKSKNIDYIEITDTNIMIEKGYMSVPVLEVDDKVMNFTDANTWINNYKE